MNKVNCTTCNGQGSLLNPHYDQNGEFQGDEYFSCPTCAGSGLVDKCEKCKSNETCLMRDKNKTWLRGMEKNE